MFNVDKCFFGGHYVKTERPCAGIESANIFFCNFSTYDNYL
jgi:hypothetical protein